MAFRLDRVSPDSANPTSFTVTANLTVSVGKEGSVKLASVANPSLTSRHHASLASDPKRGVLVVTNTSTNGILVDSTPFTGRQILVKAGSTITFGLDMKELTYSVSGGSPIAATTRRTSAGTPRGGSTGATASAKTRGRSPSPVGVRPTRSSASSRNRSVSPVARTKSVHVDCVDVGLPSSPQQDPATRPVSAAHTAKVADIRSDASSKKQHRVSDVALFIDADGLRHLERLTDSDSTTMAQNPAVTACGRARMALEHTVQASVRASRRLDYEQSLLQSLVQTYDPDSDAFHHAPSTAEAMAVGACSLCRRLRQAITQSPLCVRLQSPVSVFGDIHGSFADIRRIHDSVIPFGCHRFLTSPLLFLGDYVDRGPHSVEVVLYLFALKLLCPAMVVLLRGNHEDRCVNGDVRQYGSGSFLVKCKERFGDRNGTEVWENMNEVFALLPLCTIVDDDVFATHGGVPQLANDQLEDLSRNRSEEVPPTAAFAVFQQLLDDGQPRSNNPLGPYPRLQTLLPDPDDSPLMAQQRTLARQLCWNDPISSDQGPGTRDAEQHLFDDAGFRPNRGRGDADRVILEFSRNAAHDFLDRHGWSLMLRAHQHHDGGLKLAHAARIVTVFTASDYSGNGNAAGACLVANGRIQMVAWDRARTQQQISTTTASQRSTPSLTSGVLPSTANSTDGDARLDDLVDAMCVDEEGGEGNAPTLEDEGEPFTVGPSTTDSDSATGSTGPFG